MTQMARLKLILAGIALLLFVAGVRMENAPLRWAAIILLAGSFLLRFHKPKQ